MRADIPKAGCRARLSYDPRMDRRSLLKFGAACAWLGLPARALAEAARSGALVSHDLLLEGDKKLARRCLLLVPRDVTPATRLPLLVLCHGLGETGDELAGIHAWSRPYGLVRAYDRLRSSPLQRAPGEAKYLSDERMAELNAELSARPLQGLAIACPFTPNPHKLLPSAMTLDRYAAWLEQSLLPVVRAKANIADRAESTGISGVSLGGYVALEVFSRKPQLFGTFGCVQGAFGAGAASTAQADRLARAVAAAGPRRAQIVTSSADPYRRANEELSQKLLERGVSNTLLVTPGPHSQAWLRESGSLEVVLWHDRALRTLAGEGKRSAPK